MARGGRCHPLEAGRRVPTDVAAERPTPCRRNPLFVYKTPNSLASRLLRKDILSRRVAPPVHSSEEDVRGEILERKFLEFGEAASAFVREISSAEGMSRRREAASVKVNVNITKKVFSKWSIEILMSTYSLNSAGFGDLKRLLKGISSRVLSKKLKDLEELGFVDREVIESRPPKVRYALSKRGEVLARLGEPVILYLRESMK